MPMRRAPGSWAHWVSPPRPITFAAVSTNSDQASWINLASRTIIASPCGIGWADVIRCGRPSGPDCGNRSLAASALTEFLKGASDIDRHFTTAPFEQNLPLLLGLLGAWNRTFLGLPTLAVLPYDQRLARRAGVPATARDGEQREIGVPGWPAREFRHSADRLGGARARMHSTRFFKCCT